MKHILFKSLIAAWLLSTLAFSSGASAHDQAGALGASVAATDVYLVSCTDDGSGTPYKLVVQIQDAAPVKSPLVSLLILSGTKAANTTDSVDGNTAYSPTLNFAGQNPSSYTLVVSKTFPAIAETYTIQYHCETSSGDHTGTNITPLQNQ